MGTLEHIDYDVHGLVGIRLIHPSASDAAAVARQLGPLRRSLSRQPDILVRFVKHLPTPRMRHVRMDRDGFTDHGFFLFGKPGKEAKVRIAFDQIGEQCEILCESGVHAVPLLMTILNLSVLKKDCVPLHASAFVYKGTGVLVTGWAKGGKTEALLSFALQGAEYVGDEWVILSGDGQKMYGIPENIRLWDWHLEYLPHVRRQLKREDVLRFKGIHLLDSVQRMVPNGKLGKTFPARWLRQAMPALKRQLNVTVSPQDIFCGAFGGLVSKAEKLFLMMSHRDSSFSVVPCDPLVIVRRMISSIRYEQLPFIEHYLAFKFAFPEKGNEFIERAHELQYDILCRALAGKEAYVVGHPYPFSLHELFERMRPFCEVTANGRAA